MENSECQFKPMPARYGFNINWRPATSISPMLLLSFFNFARRIGIDNRLIGCFYMIWKKTKMKLNWHHYEELPNVPINLIINNYDNVINFASYLSFIKRFWCSWYMFLMPRNRASSPKIIKEFVTYFF